MAHLDKSLGTPDVLYMTNKVRYSLSNITSEGLHWAHTVHFQASAGG